MVPWLSFHFEWVYTFFVQLSFLVELVHPNERNQLRPSTTHATVTLCGSSDPANIPIQLHC